MVSNTENGQSVLWLFDLLAFTFLAHYFGDQLVLNQNECFHWMLQGQLMFTHLTQNSAYVQMDIRWVQYLQTVVNALVTVMKVIIFNF